MKIAKLKWKHMILLVISTSSLQLRAEEETAAVGPVEASACEKNKDEVVLAADETLSSRADGWGLKWSGSEIAKSLQENNFNITDLSSDLSQLGLSGRVVDPSANNNIQLDCSKSKEEMSLAISEQWAKHRAQERIDLAFEFNHAQLAADGDRIESTEHGVVGAHRILCTLTLADVLHRADHALRPAGGVEEHLAPRVHAPLGAVGPHHAVGAVEVQRAGQCADEHVARQPRQPQQAVQGARGHDRNEHHQCQSQHLNTF